MMWRKQSPSSSSAKNWLKNAQRREGQEPPQFDGRSDTASNQAGLSVRFPDYVYAAAATYLVE
jgi:hypothetical protein